MQLRTFRAPSMADALAEIKRDLGQDAVILHARQYKVGGVLGVGTRPMCEIIASPGPRPGAPGSASARRRDAAAPAPAPRAQRGSAAPRPDPGGDAAAGALADAVPPRLGERASAAAVLDRVERAQRPPRATPPDPAPGLVRDGLEEDLRAIKDMIGRVLQASRRTALAVAPQPERSWDATDALSAQYLRLIEAEVAADIAEQVIGSVREALAPEEIAQARRVEREVRERLAALVPVADTPAAPTRAPDGRPTIIALVGPTGVGKTTTAAKLAASYKLRHGRRVGLVTSDTYRIAAVDQLRVYANIIGLPLKVPMTPPEMSGACESLRDCDVILIDTAGRSPGDGDRLEELRQFMDAAQPHEVHLVLSSTAAQSALLEAARRFSVVNPDRIVFTKLDEAVNFGVLVNVAHRVRLRLSYLTMGQEVPDHIEPGRADRLAGLVLGLERAR